MAMSDNSKTILAYLKANHGKNLTSADIADALDLPKATVNGAFTAMQKKGLGVRVDAEIPGAVEVSFLTVTDEGRAADTAEMGETVQKIINYLSSTADHVTLDDLADAIGVEKRSVNGSFNALVKKGLCARTPAKVEAMIPVKYMTLTEAGLSFDADAE